ncbi:MAG: hypothetical protein ACFFCQ_05925 [Promethearchaeota archaeon]
MFKKHKESEVEEFIMPLIIGTAFTLIFIIGLLYSFITEASFWITGWAIIPGLVLLGVGIAKGYELKQNQELIKGLLHSYKGQTISLDEIASEIGMDSLKLKRQLIRMRSSLDIPFRYQGSNIVIGEAPRTLESTVHPTTKGYVVCPNCQSVPEDQNSRFCEYCGTKM